MADGQGAALAGADHQILLAFEEDTQRKGPMQALQRLARGLDGFCTFVQMVAQQVADGFGVGFRFEHRPTGGKLGAQLAEVFDNAIVNHRHAARQMRMGVQGGRRAMGGPAGVADAGFAGQGVVDQKIGEVDELAHRATTVQLALVDGGDPGAVIAAILQPLQRLDQKGGHFVMAQNPNNSAHLLQNSNEE